MKSFIMVMLCFFLAVAKSLSGPIPKGELEKYECIFTAILEENANGRHFGVDDILKGMATPANTSLLNKFNDSNRISPGQRVIVFASKDGKKCKIIFIKGGGAFKFKVNDKEYSTNVDDIVRDLSVR